jgi:hypothetical protein
MGTARDDAHAVTCGRETRRDDAANGTGAGNTDLQRKTPKFTSEKS